jgi:hypothetical protein
MQKIIYTWMFSLLVWEENVKAFDYLIFTKHKKPRFQVMSYIPDWKFINSFVWDLFKAYVKSMDTWVYAPMVNKTCFFCKLKSTTCPAHVQQDEF